MKKVSLTTLFVLTTQLSCATGEKKPTIAGNERGSKPINKVEEIRYKRAILKCYKTGGSRVVKIQGKLNCY